MEFLRRVAAALVGGKGSKRQRRGADSLYVGDHTLLIRTRRFDGGARWRHRARSGILRRP